ncbi:MAG: hypothetical protein AB7D96_13480 [Arcobacteraceae bacterium]
MMKIKYSLMALACISSCAFSQESIEVDTLSVTATKSLIQHN